MKTRKQLAWTAGLFLLGFITTSCVQYRGVYPTTLQARGFENWAGFKIPVPSTWKVSSRTSEKLALTPIGRKDFVYFLGPYEESSIRPEMRNTLRDPRRVRTEKLPNGLTCIVERVSDSKGNYLRGTIGADKHWVDFFANVYTAPGSDGYLGDVYQITRSLEDPSLKVKKPSSKIDPKIWVGFGVLIIGLAVLLRKAIATKRSAG